MANGEHITTEWEDIQRRLGNLPPEEVPITEEQLGNLVEETALQHDPFEKRSLGELNEMEDDMIDDPIFEEYRRKRMQEIVDYRKGAKYGSMLEISEPQFVDEVTKCKDWVILHLYSNSVMESKVMDQLLSTLAAKFPHTKFLKIISTQCIRNYPDTNLPTILVYRGGELVKQFVGLSQLGGKRFNGDDVEWALSRLEKDDVKCILSEMEENPRTTTENKVYLNIHRR